MCHFLTWTNNTFKSFGRLVGSQLVLRPFLSFEPAERFLKMIMEVVMRILTKTLFVAIFTIALTPLVAFANCGLIEDLCIEEAQPYYDECEREKEVNLRISQWIFDRCIINDDLDTCVDEMFNRTTMIRESDRKCRQRAKERFESCMDRFSYRVTLHTCYWDVTFDARCDKYILDTAEEHGIDLNYSGDRAGSSSTGAAILLKGQVDQEDQSFLDDDEIADGFILYDVAYPLTDIEIDICGAEELLYSR